MTIHNIFLNKAFKLFGLVVPLALLVSYCVVTIPIIEWIFYYSVIAFILVLDCYVGDPGSYDNLYNRKKSKGKYGIWGHYLEELVIESVIYDPKEKILDMFIGS